jgi:hypothetical protein
MDEATGHHRWFAALQATLQSLVALLLQTDPSAVSSSAMDSVDRVVSAGWSAGRAPRAGAAGREVMVLEAAPRDRHRHQFTQQ